MPLNLSSLRFRSMRRQIVCLSAVRATRRQVNQGYIILGMRNAGTARKKRAVLNEAKHAKIFVTSDRALRIGDSYLLAAEIDVIIKFFMGDFSAQTWVLGEISRTSHENSNAVSSPWVNE